MTIWEKIKEVLHSFRFWYTVIFALAFLLDSNDIISGALAKTLEIFAGMGITIRTASDLIKAISLIGSKNSLDK